MADFRAIYQCYQKERGKKQQSASVSSKRGPQEKVYSRDTIIRARCFSREEQDFLDWLLVEDDYTIDEVKRLVKKQIERMEC